MPVEQGTETWWYCERLKLKAMKPQCEILLKRQAVGDFGGAYVRPFEVYRPLPCETCKEGKRILKRLASQKGVCHGRQEGDAKVV